MEGKGISASPTMATACEAQNIFISQEQKRSMSHSAEMNCTASAHEAATALRDLALNHQNGLFQPVPRPVKSRKRERPMSMDLSSQGNVRDMITPRCLANLDNGNRSNEDDSTVLPDSRVADSFLVPRFGEHQAATGLDHHSKPKLMLAKDGPRKRTCGNASKQEAFRIGRLVTERAMEPGPGMWDGII